MKKNKRQKKLRKSKSARIKNILGRIPLAEKCNTTHKPKKGKGSYNRKIEKIRTDINDN